MEQFGDADNASFETVFVLADFDSAHYHHLYKRDNRIVGPPVVLQCALKEEVSASAWMEANGLTTVFNGGARFWGRG